MIPNTKYPIPNYFILNQLFLNNKFTYRVVAFLSLMLLALMMNVPALAQDIDIESYESASIKEHDFNKANWEKAVQGLNYSKKKIEEEEKPQEEQPVENDFDWDGSIFNGDWSNFFKIFFFVIVIGLLAFIIIRLMGNTMFLSNQKVNKTGLNYSIEKVEEDIHKADLEDFAQQALKQQDYRLAIRLYFLQTLKLLSENKFIKWKRDKTNNEYIREMSGTDLFREFRDLSRLFDRVWYSDVKVQEHHFNQIRPRFLDFLKKITK
jgi:hypothetical protein